MLITVKERTREFGIRKALGAKPVSILWLIIAESVAITTFFGYIGMVAGIAVTEYMNAVAGEQVMDIGVASATVFPEPHGGVEYCYSGHPYPDNSRHIGGILPGT